MKVDDLINELDNYGGHLPVMMRKKEDGELVDIIVEDGKDSDGMTVVIISPA